VMHADRATKEDGSATEPDGSGPITQLDLLFNYIELGKILRQSLMLPINGILLPSTSINSSNAPWLTSALSHGATICWDHRKKYAD